MTLSLYIKQEHIESMELDMEGIYLIDQREQVVKQQAARFRMKYIRDIALASDWEIILTAKSKMNEPSMAE